MQRGDNRKKQKIIPDPSFGFRHNCRTEMPSLRIRSTALYIIPPHSRILPSFRRNLLKTSFTTGTARLPHFAYRGSFLPFIALRAVAAPFSFYGIAYRSDAFLLLSLCVPFSYGFACRIRNKKLPALTPTIIFMFLYHFCFFLRLSQINQAYSLSHR